MLKKLYWLPLLLLTTHAFSAYPGADTAKITYTLGYESYNLPAGLDRLGVVDLGMLYHFNSLFYGGMQLDSAVRGNSGGYYSLALNGGLQYPLLGSFVGRTGILLGGGGGHDISQTVGGGFFYQPYIGLDYDFQTFAVGLQYSHIRFPSGMLSSSQLGLQFSSSLGFSYAEFALRNTSLNDYAATSADSLYVAMLGNEVLPDHDMHDTHGQINDARFNMIGIEMGKYATQKVYYFLRALGAMHGRSNGFAALLGGVGYQLPIVEKVDAFADMGVGSAGGGAVNTGGGFVYMPTLGLRYHVTSRWAVSASGSLFNSTAGDFKTKAFTLGLRYDFNNISDVKTQVGSQLNYQGWRVHVFNQTYFKPKSTSQTTLPTMQLLGAQLDFYAQRYLYLAAQTAFAYRGQNVGGYFTGMFGPGLSTTMGQSDRLSVYAQMLVGAAGGGGLDISSGAMIQPEVGVQYQLTHALGLQLGAGRLIALKGKFDSTVLSFGLDSSFSTLS